MYEYEVVMTKAFHIAHFPSVSFLQYRVHVSTHISVGRDALNIFVPHIYICDAAPVIQECKTLKFDVFEM